MIRLSLSFRSTHVDPLGMNIRLEVESSGEFRHIGIFLVAFCLKKNNLKYSRDLNYLAAERSFYRALPRPCLASYSLVLWIPDRDPIVPFDADPVPDPVKFYVFLCVRRSKF